MTTSSGPSGLGGSKTGKLIGHYETLAKQEALEAEKSKKKPVQPQGEVQPQQQVSTGQTSTFTPVSTDKGKAKLSQDKFLEEMSHKPIERPTVSDTSVGQKLMEKRLGKMKKLEGESKVETTTTAPPQTESTRTTANTEEIFSKLTKQHPHLKNHFNGLHKARVQVELVTNDSQAATGAYFYTPPKKGLVEDQTKNPAIRVRNDPPQSQMSLYDNILYESFNGVAQQKYRKLDDELRQRKLTPAEYGVAKARVEAQGTLGYVDTLLKGFQGEERAGARGKLSWLAKQVPPDLTAPGAREIQDKLNLEAQKLGITEKGLRALAWAERLSPGYIMNPDPQKHLALEEAFIQAPHKSEASKTDRASLSSGDLYQYEGLERQTAGGIVGLLQSPLTGLNFNEAGEIRKTIGELRGRLQGFDENALPENASQAERDGRANTKVAVYQEGLSLLREEIGKAKGQLSQKLEGLKRMESELKSGDPLLEDVKGQIKLNSERIEALIGAEAKLGPLQLSEGVKRFAGVQG
jgi:hypothetical protein